MASRHTSMIKGSSFEATNGTKARVHEGLTNGAYIGEHCFNKFEKRDVAVRRLKPQHEWVLIKVEAISTG